MRIVLQRVDRAEVTVDNQIIGKINKGLLLLVGIGHNDTTDNADFLANKINTLRVFEDEDNKMNKSVQDINGEILIISQFTLYGDCRKGRRPDFTQAAKPEYAEYLFNYFVDKMKEISNLKIETGQFAAHMKVDFVNDGPVTLILEK